MSYRDRQGQPPSLYDSNSHSKRETGAQPGDATAPPGRGQSRGRPWHVDPAEVDRYLAEREQALRLERPGNPAPSRRPTDPTTPPARPRTGLTASDYPDRTSQPSPRPSAPLPPADIQWPDLDLDDESWPAAGVDSDPDHDEPAYVPARPPRRRARAATRTGARERTPRSAPQIRMPRFVAGAALANDRTSLFLLAFTALSALILWAVFASRIGHVGPTVALHLDAVGVPDVWGPAKSLWRIPLLATILPLMTLIVAWAVARFDQFASRFLLAIGLCLQFLIWIAAIRLLW